MRRVTRDLRLGLIDAQRPAMMDANTVEFAMPLPTRSDFVRSEDLDEIEACRAFLGKTITEALDVVQENQFASGELLSHMGTPAFVFYVLAFLAAMDPSVVDFNVDPKGWVIEIDVLRQRLVDRLATPDRPDLLSQCASAVSSWCHRTASAIENHDSAVAEALRECGSRYERA